LIISKDPRYLFFDFVKRGYRRKFDKWHDKSESGTIMVARLFGKIKVRSVMLKMMDFLISEHLFFIFPNLFCYLKKESRKDASHQF
jgi:hypothetical protein